MTTFAEIWKRWKRAEREGGPLALAHELARAGYMCPKCGRLLAAGAECPGPELAPGACSAPADIRLSQ